MEQLPEREIFDTVCGTDYQLAVKMMLEWKTQKQDARMIRGLKDFSFVWFFFQRII